MTSNLPSTQKTDWVNSDIVMPADTNGWGTAINTLSADIPLYAHTGNFYTATFASNIYTLTPLSGNATLSAYTNGMSISFFCPAANTGSCKVKIGSLSAVNIKDMNNTALTASALRQGELVSLVYDSANSCFKVSSLYASTSLDNLNSIGSKKILPTQTGNNGKFLTTNGTDASWQVVDLLDKLTKKQLTNCLLEIPQRIKYTLVDGTFTLLAGSVVIIPYGTTDQSSTYTVGSNFINSNLKVVDRKFANNQFFVWVETQADVVRQSATGGTELLRTLTLSFNSGATSIVAFGSSVSVSDDSEATGTTQLFYNKTSNLVKSKSSGSISSNTASFPIATANQTETYQIAEMVNVFNGFGYIGTVIWADRDIKGLYPNGYNDNGTLNNVEWATTNCTTVDISDAYSNATIVFRCNGNGISLGTLVYNQEINYNTTTDGQLRYTMRVGTVYISTNQLSDFNVRKTVNLADITTSDSKVSKSGDTMTGTLNISIAGSNQLKLINSNITKGTNPSSIQYAYMTMCDKNSVSLGSIYMRYGTDGSTSTRIASHKSSDTSATYIAVGFDADGKEYFIFPKCTTKPTTTSTATSSCVNVVVKNYLSGTSGYRKWSDGLIEQWGRVSQSSDNATVSLILSYSNTNYHVLLTPGYNNTPSVGVYASCLVKPSTNMTESSFKVHFGNGSSGSYTMWYTCGY